MKIAQKKVVKSSNGTTNRSYGNNFGTMVNVPNQNAGLLSLILAIVFTTLKLTNVIAWPWVWVLSPLWLPFAFVISIILLFFTFAVFYKVLNSL